MSDGIARAALKSAFERLGISPTSELPNDILAWKVCDNGANMVAAWAPMGGRLPCFEHTLELCTIPFTWVQKRKKDTEPKIEKGSVQESFAKARGIVGYLHLSVNCLDDFHTAQESVNLPQNQIELDCPTRWRSAHAMASQFVYNKDAVLELDKHPAYRDPGEVWGKNKLNFENWDHLEQSGGCLDNASSISLYQEGDKYITSSAIVPMAFKLIATSSPTVDVYFQNRANDEYNDPQLNPVNVAHAGLNSKVAAQRVKYHAQLISRFDSEVPLPTKKMWYISSMLDPRYKKLIFKYDNMLPQAMRDDAVKWLTEEYVKTYKGKFGVAKSGAQDQVRAPQLKRRKVSAATIFDEESEASDDDKAPIEDELAAYLALPQMKFESECGVCKTGGMQPSSPI